jgi:hypothetical protein
LEHAARIAVVFTVENQFSIMNDLHPVSGPSFGLGGTVPTYEVQSDGSRSGALTLS